MPGRSRRKISAGLIATTAALWCSSAMAADAPKPALLPRGYLATDGNQIVDDTRHPVRLASVSWNGAEYLAAPMGLEAQTYSAVLDAIKDAGFNSIRFPFSEEGLHTKVEPYYVGRNSVLVGLTGVEIMDTIIAHAGRIGLKVVLDEHRSRIGGGPNDNGLWYDPGYMVGPPNKQHPETTADWIAMWTGLAQRYRNNPTVIGADLNNEPFAATWGGDPRRDWHAAATQCGNAIQAVNPDWLIFVEGTLEPSMQQYGEDLSVAASLPVELVVKNRVVYSPHVYPVSVAGRMGAQGPSQWNALFGYLYTQNIAPIWIGEYGANLAGPTPDVDATWLKTAVAYFNAPGGEIGPSKQPMSTAYWAWNGDKAPNLSVSQSDHLTPYPEVMRIIGATRYFPGP